MLSLNTIKVPVLSNRMTKSTLGETSTSLLNLSFTQKKTVSAINKDGDVFFKGNSTKLGPDFGDMFKDFFEDFFNPSDYASFLK